MLSIVAELRQSKLLYLALLFIYLIVCCKPAESFTYLVLLKFSCHCVYAGEQLSSSRTLNN